MNEDILRYNIDTFNNIYKLYEKDHIKKCYIDKVHFLKTNYSCFNQSHDPKKIFEKKKLHKKDLKTQKNKFHIIMHDFSNETTNKRHLIGYLNKLTEKNKDVIYPKINEIILNNNNNEFLNVILTYIKSNGCDLYIKIIENFDENTRNIFFNDKWNSYIENREWIPPDYIFHNDILTSDKEYDMYCKYKKWKKETFNMISLWIILRKDIGILLRNIFDFFELYLNRSDKISEKIGKSYIVYKHVLNLFLEQIIQILAYLENKSIIDKIKKLDEKQFESSTRFLIYNIIDKK